MATANKPVKKQDDMQSYLKSLIAEQTKPRVIKEEASDSNLKFSQSFAGKYIGLYSTGTYLVTVPEAKEFLQDKSAVDVDITGRDFSIEWGLSFEVRKEGVKNFSLELLAIAGTINLKDIETDQELDIEFVPNVSDYTVVVEVPIVNNGGIFIDEIEIDFGRKTITLV